MGAKNFLPLVLSDIKSFNTSGTWSDNVYSYRGVDFTINTDDDGNITSIVADGTATDGESRLTMKYVSQTDYQGKLLNGCPSSGSANTYSLIIQRTTSPYTWFHDDGSGVLIGDIGSTGTIFISIKKDYVASNLTFYPMIRLATDTDDTFQPYAKTNLQLTNDVASLNTDLAQLEISVGSVYRKRVVNGALSYEIPSDSNCSYLYIATRNHYSNSTGIHTSSIGTIFHVSSSEELYKIHLAGTESVVTVSGTTITVASGASFTDLLLIRIN